MIGFRSVLAMICRWKFDLLNFSLLNHMVPKHRVFFCIQPSNDLKLFCDRYLVLYWYMTVNMSILLNFFYNFIDFSSDWTIRAMHFLYKNFQIENTWTIFVSHVLILIMSINITNFFNSLSRILLFFCNKISKCIEFLLYFHSFLRRNNFWLNKQIS